MTQSRRNWREVYRQVLLFYCICSFALLHVLTLWKGISILKRIQITTACFKESDFVFVPSVPSSQPQRTQHPLTLTSLSKLLIPISTKRQIKDITLIVCITHQNEYSSSPHFTPYTSKPPHSIRESRGGLTPSTTLQNYPQIPTHGQLNPTLKTLFQCSHYYPPSSWLCSL